jgi:hypothetical protein
MRSLKRTFSFTSGGRSDRRVEKLHNEELHDLYSTPSIIRIIKSRRMRLAGYAVQMDGDKRNANMLLVGKPEGKRLRRSKHRWVDNIKMDLREIEWGDGDWIGLAQDRGQWRTLVNAIMNLRGP